MAYEPSEFELQSYVDGCLDGPGQARLERYLADHPQLAERLRGQREVGARLRRCLQPLAYDHGDMQAVAAALQCRRRQQRSRLLIRAAAALAWVAVGAFGTWLGTDPVPAPVPMADAVAAHVTFVAERAHPVELRVDAQDSLQAWLSARIGRSIVVPDLGALGLRFMGGRLLSSEHGPAGLLMYDDDLGTRLTVYVRPDRGVRDPGLHALERDGVALRYWYADGFAYAVGCRPGYSGLDAITARVRSTLTS